MSTIGLTKLKMKKHKPKILIIEDEYMILETFKIALASQYDVSATNDGAEGLALIKKEKPDVVLLDILLPNMNGFDVLKEAKNDPTTKHIPFIIVSNCVGEQDTKKALKLGAEAYLVKTHMDFKEIDEKIEEALNKK